MTMLLGKKINTHEIFQLLLNKWWLPVTLVVASLFYTILSSTFWTLILGGYSPTILVIDLFNGAIYFISIIMMFIVGLYQFYRKKRVFALFNILVSILIFFAVGFLGMAFT